MKNSLYIVLFFIVGLCFGKLDLLPLLSAGNDLSFYVLCALIFSVGFSIGSDASIFRQFLSLNRGLLFLPFVAMLGTGLGSLFVACLNRSYSVTEWLAVGSGFGYYSLSSVLISQYKGAELGVIALISNIVREMITLLGAPLLVRFWGTFAPIATGGATAMDTTLPIIISTCGKKYVPVSIYSAFVMDFSVPFLVTFFCSF